MWEGVRYCCTWAFCTPPCFSPKTRPTLKCGSLIDTHYDKHLDKCPSARVLCFHAHGLSSNNILHGRGVTQLPLFFYTAINYLYELPVLQYYSINGRYEREKNRARCRPSYLCRPRGLRRPCRSVVTIRVPPSNKN